MNITRVNLSDLHKSHPALFVGTLADVRVNLEKHLKTTLSDSTVRRVCRRRISYVGGTRRVTVSGTLVIKFSKTSVSSPAFLTKVRTFKSDGAVSIESVNPFDRITNKTRNAFAKLYARFFFRVVPYSPIVSTTPCNAHGSTCVIATRKDGRREHLTQRVQSKTTRHVEYHDEYGNPVERVLEETPSGMVERFYAIRSMEATKWITRTIETEEGRKQIREAIDHRVAHIPVIHCAIQKDETTETTRKVKILEDKGDKVVLGNVARFVYSQYERYRMSDSIPTVQGKGIGRISAFTPQDILQELAMQLWYYLVMRKRLATNLEAYLVKAASNAIQNAFVKADRIYHLESGQDVTQIQGGLFSTLARHERAEYDSIFDYAYQSGLDR